MRNIRIEKFFIAEGKAVRGTSEKAKGEKPVYHLNAVYERGAVGIEIKQVEKRKTRSSACRII